MNSKRQSDGFAMIEVLLAVVVLAIGLLAGSKMQLLGLNATQGAMMRSHATMAVNDIIDRMRINPDGVMAGEYDGASTDSPPADPGCVNTGCTPAQLAQHDLRVWASYFGNAQGTDTAVAIHQAVGSISVAPTSQVRTVAVTWEELIDGEVEVRSVSVGVRL